MSTIANSNAQPSEADIAFEILKTKGGSMHYSELTEEILRRKKVPLSPANVAAVLTQINLDTRFSYLGQGEWGLKSKMSTRSNRRIPTITLMNKSYDEEDDEAILEDKDDMEEQDTDSLPEDDLELEDYEEDESDQNREDWEE